MSMIELSAGDGCTRTLYPLQISDANLLKYYKFPRGEIIYLIQTLDSLLKRNTRRPHAIPTSTQVLVAVLH